MKDSDVRIYTNKKLHFQDICIKISQKAICKKYNIDYTTMH